MPRKSSNKTDFLRVSTPTSDVSSGGGGTSRSSSVSGVSGVSGRDGVIDAGGGDGVGKRTRVLEEDDGRGKVEDAGGRGRKGRMEAVESGDEEAEEVRPSWGVALPLSPTSPTIMSTINRHLPSISTLQSLQNIQLGRLSSYLPYGSAPVVPATVEETSNANAGPEQSEEVEEEVEEWGVARGTGREALERCRWEQLDLMDGRGMRTILLKVNPSVTSAVQLWDVTHSCSSDGEFSREIPYIDRHLSARSQSMDTSTSPGSLLTRSMEIGRSTVETAVPLEVMRLPFLPQFEEDKVERLYRTRNGNDLPGMGGDCSEQVLDACMVADGVAGGGFALAILSVILRGKPGAWRNGVVYLNILDASTGEMLRKFYVGDGNNGELVLSSRALVLTIGGTSPGIHFLSPVTWLPIANPIVDAVGLEPATGLPVVALKGRMFAHVSTRYDASHSVYDEDHQHGDVITRASIRARHATANHSSTKTRRFSNGTHEMSRRGRTSPADQVYQSPSVQTTLLNATAGISTEVAKGVWGGLRILGSVAISTASKSSMSAVNGMLSKSAPSDNSLLSPSPAGGSPDGSARIHSPNRVGVHDNSLVDKQDVGKWVNVMDLGSLTSPSRGRSRQLSPFASFAIPNDSHSLASTMTQPGSCRVTKLSFSPLGSHLCVALQGGRAAVVVEIRPSGQARPRRTDHAVFGKKGEVWLRYELRRGATPAVISRIQWDSAGRWVALGTARTIHLFTIHAEGGKPEASNHCLSRTRNVPELQPLSVILQPSFRLRAPRKRELRELDRGFGKPMAAPCQEPPLSSQEGLSFIFGRAASRQAEVTLPNGRNVNVPHGMQDILIYAPALSMLEGCRLYISPRDALEADPSAGLYSSKSRTAEKSSRGAGGRPKLLERAVSAMLRTPAIHIAEGVIAKWQLPPVSIAPLVLNVGGGRAANRERSKSRSRQRNLAAIEINTSSTASKLLPGSIYADKAVEFADLKDPTSKMRYRRQVLVSAIENEDAFDGPLSTAIQSHLDSKGAAPVLPALPNGSTQARWIGSTNHVMNAARDIVRMSRRQSQVSEGHLGSYSYGDQLNLDEETGFLYDPGPDLEDMTNGSSAEETPDDGWEDDLAAGRLEMDDLPANPGKK